MPVTRQEQRLSLQGNGGTGIADLAVQQLLDEFDNFKKTMMVQNRDLTRTNAFAQARIRQLENSVSDLEERVVQQAAAKTRAEARALDLEHQLACFEVAFNFLSTTVHDRRRGVDGEAYKNTARQVRTQLPELPAPPKEARGNVVRVDASNLPAGVVRRVAQQHVQSLGRVQEEVSTPVLVGSPRRSPQAVFDEGQREDQANVLYPPLPSPTVTDVSSAPSPVRTPDLDLPISLPLQFPIGTSATLAGLNIRIDGVEEGGPNIFQTIRASSRPGLSRSDSATWSVGASEPEPSRPASSGHGQARRSLIGGAELGPGLIRPQARRRMQGRTSELLTSVSSSLSSSTSRPSIVGATSPGSTTSTTSIVVEQNVRQALSDQSNTHTVQVSTSQVTTSIESRSGIDCATEVVTEKANRIHEHVDTPMLRDSLSLSPSDESSRSDRFATVPSSRKRRLIMEPSRTARVRSRSEDSAICTANTHICSQTGTRQHGQGCKCTPCECENGTTDHGNDSGHSTPRGMASSLPSQPSRSVAVSGQSRHATPAVAHETTSDGASEDESSSGDDQGADDEGPATEGPSGEGRPTRRARQSVNYVLPKLNTKMRKPAVTPDASSRSVGSQRAGAAAASDGRRLLSTGTSKLNNNLSTRLSAIAAPKSRPQDDLQRLEGSQALRQRSRSSSSDASIMSFTSGSSAAPVVRSPCLSNGQSTAVDPARRGGKTSSAAMSKQGSDAVATGCPETDCDRSSGSTTVVPTESGSSSSPSATQAHETGGLDLTSSRPKRRSSAAVVSYAEPSLVTKMRKPATNGEVRSLVRKAAVDHGPERAVRSRSKTEPAASQTRRNGPSGDGHCDHGSSDEAGDDDPQQPTRRHNNRLAQDSGEHDSENVSASIARYSNRTLRKSGLPPSQESSARVRAASSTAATRISIRSGSSSVGNVVNGGSRNGAASTSTEPNALPADSPKRKATRRSASTDNLAGSISASPLFAQGTQSWGRGMTAKAMSGLSLSTTRSNVATPSLPSLSAHSDPMLSPRASLHAMLTTSGSHAARERSGSSTSSGSTIRGLGGALSGGETAIWTEDEDAVAEEEDDEDEEREEGIRRGPGSVRRNGAPSSDPYDDRMDPLRFSDSSPAPTFARRAKGTAAFNDHDAADDDYSDDETNADLTAEGTSSMRAVGSASFDRSTMGANESSNFD